MVSASSPSVAVPFPSHIKSLPLPSDAASTSPSSPMLLCVLIALRPMMTTTQPTVQSWRSSRLLDLYSFSRHSVQHHGLVSQVVTTTALCRSNLRHRSLCSSCNVPRYIHHLYRVCHPLPLLFSVRHRKVATYCREILICLATALRNLPRRALRYAYSHRP